MEKSKKRLKDPKGKQRSHISKFIVQNKSRQEFLPLLGKYVDLLKSEPLHHNSFASRLTTKGRPCVVSHTWRFRHLKPQAEGNFLEDQRLLLLPWDESGLCPALQQRVQLKTSSAKHCLCITFSYGFTWLESKYFCWHFATLIQELLSINYLSRGPLWNFTVWHLLQSNSEMQFLFTQELRCALSK